jgi:hypothetical protein
LTGSVSFAPRAKPQFAQSEWPIGSRSSGFS